MTKRLPVPAILLVVAAFWATLAGGYISVESVPLLPTDSSLAMAILGDAAVATLSHALIALLVVVALVWLLAERKIQQVPKDRLGLILVLFFGLILGTMPLSPFRAAAIPLVAEWLVYGMAFFAVVAGLGRRRGPLALVIAVFAGCFLVAVRGILEYGDMRATDPTWRIFAGWIGPNAVAAILAVGFLLGLAVTLVRERLEALLAGLATVMIGFALVLTQSKGGLLALAVGLVAFAVSALTWGKRDVLPKALRGAAVVAAMVVLTFGLQASQRAATAKPGAQAATALSRFGNAGETQEQSSEFRKLLWKGAVELIKDNPVGNGIGSYRFLSAKPGLTTQTQLAHNSYLQLGAESGIVTPILLLVALGYWTLLLFRGGSQVPLQARLLRAGILGAVAAVGAHSLVDSDLHYFGVGLVFFMLLGAGLLLATDAVAPEFVPKPARSGVAALAGLVAATLLYTGSAEAARASARGLLMTRNPGAVEAIGGLKGRAPYDGETWALSARTTQGPERLEDLKRAADATPSARNLRALAQGQAEIGDTTAAESTLMKARAIDPNNLLSLRQLMELYIKSGNDVNAKNVAERLVRVEGTPYFEIRSLPDLVPLQTAEARLYLANSLSGSAKAEMMKVALDQYRQYATRTIPQIKAMAQAQPPQDYGGERLENAEANMRLAEAKARELASLYRTLDRDGDAKAADELASAFAESTR